MSADLKSTLSYTLIAAYPTHVTTHTTSETETTIEDKKSKETDSASVMERQKRQTWTRWSDDVRNMIIYIRQYDPLTLEPSLVLPNGQELQEFARWFLVDQDDRRKRIVADSSAKKAKKLS